MITYGTELKVLYALCFNAKKSRRTTNNQASVKKNSNSLWTFFRELSRAIINQCVPSCGLLLNKKV